MLLRTRSRAVTCLSRQFWRPFSTSYRRLADKPPALPSSSAPRSSPPASSPYGAVPPPPEPAGPLANAPRYYGKKHYEFTPTVLSRPIGLSQPPQAGENRGHDPRTFKQRRDDYVNYELHLARRKKLEHIAARPYFRDWRNMRFHKGKTFLPPPRPFKASLSLFFPNLYGRTLAGPYADTTPLLQGRVSVVTIFSSMWAQRQAQSFTSREAHPALHEVLDGSGGRAQLVQINIEEDWLKAMLIKLFSGSLKKQVGEANWGRYLVLRKGLSDEIRESIGVLNGRVGYTYLVDSQCRIRWAGSGDAEGDERDSLVKSLERVLKEVEAEPVADKAVGERIEETKV